jgi:cytochrome c biogenesis protein CcdA/thiol-disulfide isomerase/thioredoxin
MLLLTLFAFLAGIGTALSPCVLPVLPIALSAGATGGSRRPLGIVTGLVLSFTFAAVALVYVIAALGLPDDLLRNIAIAGLIGFGVALVIPAIGDRIEARLSRLARSRRTTGDEGGGFLSGLLVGVPLGIVYAPCAGPILAGVITVSASQTFTAGRLTTALAYGLGSAVALYGLMLGGRRLSRKLARRSGRLQQGMGVVMVVFGVLMIANLDLRFQQAIAADLPSFLVNPTGGLERSGSVEDALADVRDGPKSRVGEDSPDELEPLFPAPELVGTQRWFNTPGGKELSLEELRQEGRVVLIDFWTYTCINCIRTLPELKAWDEKYRDQGLTIIGVHTPEFPFEKDASNVEDAIAEHGLRYPVVQDNDFATWDAFGNQFWPAKYLIDADGDVRYVHFGEGEYEATEDAIRTLLAESGRDRLGARSEATTQSHMARATPETYLGADRAERFVNGPLTPGEHDYETGGMELPPDHLALGGRWRIGDQSATAGRDASLHLNFHARRVFLVLGSPGRERDVRVLVDGEPVKTVRVKRQRLYTLVELPKPGRHTLELRPEPGVQGYAFTFG